MIVEERRCPDYEKMDEPCDECRCLNCIGHDCIGDDYCPFNACKDVEIEL